MRSGYGTKVPGVTLSGLGVRLLDYSQILGTVDYTECEVQQFVESFYNRSTDAERMGFQPPLNIRVVCEVKGPKGKVAIPAIIDTGASLNVVKDKYFNRLLKVGYKLVERAEPRTVVGVGGKPVTVKRALRVPIQVFPRKEPD